MPHILHILDASDPAAHLARRAIRTLIRHAPASFSHHVLLLGGRADERAARADGIPLAARLTPPYARRAIRALEPDLVHAWSPRTQAAARRASTPVVATSRFDRAPYPISLPDPAQRGPLRARWEAQDDEVVLLLAGESLPALDAFTFTVAAGVLTQQGRRVVAVAHPGAHGFLRARRFLEGLPEGARLIADDIDPCQALAAADAAIHCAAAPPAFEARQRHPPATAHALLRAAAMGLIAISDDRAAIRAAAIGPLAGRIRFAAPRKPMELGMAVSRALDERAAQGQSPSPQIPTEFEPAAWSAQVHARYGSRLQRASAATHRSAKTPRPPAASPAPQA